MKITLRKFAALAALFGASAIFASAASYNVNVLGTFLGTTPGNNSFGGFYKFDAPSTESGSAAATFATVISNGGFTATLTWTGSQPTLSTFILKAGNNYDTWNIANFNSASYDSIVVTNLTLMNNGNQLAQISHVEISGNTNHVPDSGLTVLLLGLALSGLGLLRRKLSAR